jgi:serine-type D-Ala-D-Ala carboxypeptidase/endopeptidase (penicillin-binding protein 4)
MSADEPPQPPPPGPPPEPAPPPEPSADPVVRAPRPTRRRSRWLVAAGVLALAGIGAVAAGLLTDTDVAVADGAPPAQRAGTPVLSARRVPEFVARPVAARNLQAAVAPVVARAPVDSCVQVNDGATALVASKDTTPLAPASNMKLLTASAALDLLGPDSRLTTKVQAAAPPAAGTVTGDLYLVGGGDPLLSTSTSSARMTNGPQPVTSMESVADQVVNAGVRRVTGSVVGDGTRYDDQRTVTGWPARFVGQGLVANLGALMVNDAWTLDPVNPAGAKGGPAPDPAAHAADVLTTLLRARGVQVDGPPRSGAAPAGATTIVEVPSKTVRELVGETLAFSDNTSAELLLKELGKAKGSGGTTQAGTAVVKQWLVDQGLPTDGVVLVDGSGLSDQDRVTCALISKVLQRGGADGILAGGLALPGQPGTLDDRFTGADLRDRLRAKTGTLRNVSALSGWLTTVTGSPLQFSVLENTGAREVQAADLAVQGDLLRALLAYPQTPPRDQLVPRAPVAATG